MSTNDTAIQQDEKTAKCNELAARLDSLALEAQEALHCKGSFEKAIRMGIAMNNLREALTPAVMKSIMKLKGSVLGFRTDERAGDSYNKPIEYGEDVVRECLIAATCQGLSPVGNQWNILSGRHYVTKEGFTYLLKNLDGLRNLKMIFHPADIRESSTSGVSKSGKEYQKIEREGYVKVDLSWEYNLVKGSEELEFCIKVNNGMSQDAIIGKAERKARAWLYNYLTNSAISDGDAEEQSPDLRNVTTSEKKNPSGVQLASDAGEAIEAEIVEPVKEEPAKPMKAAKAAKVEAPAEAIDDSEPSSVVTDLLIAAQDAGISFDELRNLAILMKKMTLEDKDLPDEAAKAISADWESCKNWIFEERKGGLL